MTAFLGSLRDFCREHGGTLVWLLTPTREAGLQWLAQLERQTGTQDRIQVRTLWDVACELAAPRLPGLHERLLSAEGVHVLIERLWPMMKARQPEGYFSRLETTPGLLAALADTVVALRNAGVLAAQFHADAFENPAKGMELAQLLAAFEVRRELSQLVDEADVWKAASNALLEKGTPLPEGVRIIVPAGTQLAPHSLAATLLQLLPSEIVVTLPTEDIFEDEHETSTQTDRQLVHWLTEPAGAPTARGDGTLRLYRAVCEADEVRAVFRRCAEQSIPFEEVEVLYTDRDVYAPILRDTVASLFHKEGVDRGVPLTCGDGWPLSDTMPGRAVLAWIDWIDSDYRQTQFLHMLRDGCLRSPVPVSSTLLRQLRSLYIGWGRARYRQCITARLEETPEMDLIGEDEATMVSSDGAAELRRLWETLESLLLLLPDAPSQVDWLDAAVRFVQDFAGGRDERDEQGKVILIHAFTDLRRWLLLDPIPLQEPMPVRLRKLVQKLRLPGEVPQPDCLHMAHWSRGGHSGRRFTFLLGFDDNRFPGGKLPHVLMLAQERMQLSPELPTDGRLREEHRQQFLRMLCNLPGHVALSFTCYDILESRERFPSWVVRSLYRLLSGEEESDQKHLDEFLGPPVGFTAKSPNQCLTAGEWWHYQLMQGAANAPELLANQYPHLAQGLRAQEQRGSPAWTAYDGRVPGARVEFTDAALQTKAFSASRLELLARCPLAFFFGQVLGTAPPPEPLEDSSWLPALVRREFAIEVFRECLALQSHGAVRTGKKSNHPSPLELLHARAARMLKRFPCPSPHVFQQEMEMLERTLKLFLHEEDAIPEVRQPVFLDVGCGTDKTAALHDLDTTEPVRVALGNGLHLRLRGRIDRVEVSQEQDRVEARITNYKLGSVSRYQDGHGIEEGRVLQHVIAYELVQARMHAVYGPQAEVTQCDFYFPGERGHGDRLQWTREQLRGERGKLAQLLTLLTEGIFPATNQSQDCEHCAHRRVCSIPRDTQASQQKLARLENAELNSFRELRNVTPH